MWTNTGDVLQVQLLLLLGTEPWAEGWRGDTGGETSPHLVRAGSAGGKDGERINVTRMCEATDEQEIPYDKSSKSHMET